MSRTDPKERGLVCRGPEALAAGKELDEMVGRAIGAPSRILYLASNDGGKSCCMSNDHKYVIVDWLADQHARGYYLDYSIAQYEYWPAYSSDIAEAWRVVEWMQKNGYAYSIQATPRHSSFTPGVLVKFRKGVRPVANQDDAHIACEENAAHSICIAALKALEAK